MESFEDDRQIDGIDEDHAGARVRMHLWRRLFDYATAYRGTLVIIGISAVAIAALDTAFPLITRAVVDEVGRSGASASLLPYAMLYAACGLAFGLTVFAFILAVGKLRFHISHDIRRDGFANLQRLSFSFYDQRPVGWLMARMTSDCDRLSNILAWGILDLIWGTTLMAAIAITMLIMEWRLALLVMLVIPAIGWVSSRFQKSILRSAREVRQTNSRITATYNESIMGVITSKAFVREDDNAGDFGALTSRMYDASVLNQVRAAAFLPIILTLSSLSLGLTLSLGGIELAGGVISTGTLIAFLTYARFFFEPIAQLGQWFAELQMAQASAERIIGLVDAVPQIRDSQEVKAAIARGGSDGLTDAGVAEDGRSARIERIELKGVGFGYGRGPAVLTDINLDVRAGETIAIVGPTGGGKSTLVSLICRFYEPTQGSILIDGIDYRQRSLHWLQSNLGVVLQSSHVFSGSVRDNIRFGRLSATNDEVEAAARTAGAHDFICALSGGYDYNVGESGGRLSAGQKQLISFARAILADPQILVMDEATSSVDTETEQHIQRGLVQVLAGRIAFVIAHRLSTIRGASRILVVEGGRITEQGTHAELLAAHKHYYDLYTQQSLQESTSSWPSAGPTRPRTA